MDTELGEARRWLEAIVRRTRESDQRYLRELQRGTLCCLRRGLEPEVSAKVAATLSVFVRGLWFERWSPAEDVTPYPSIERFLECVTPFVKDFYADAVIEEDVLAVAQTFFMQWPQAAKICASHLPKEFFEYVPGLMDSTG